MSKNKKIALIAGAAVIVVCCVVIIGVAMGWFKGNDKPVSQEPDEQIEQPVENEEVVTEPVVEEPAEEHPLIEDKPIEMINGEGLVYNTDFTATIAAWAQVEGGFVSGSDTDIKNVLNYALTHEDVYIKIVSDKRVDYVFLAGYAWAESIEPEYIVEGEGSVTTYYNVIDLMEAYCAASEEEDIPESCIGGVGNIMLFPTVDVNVLDMDAVIFDGSSIVVEETPVEGEEAVEGDTTEDEEQPAEEAPVEMVDGEAVVFNTDYTATIGAWAQVEGGFSDKGVDIKPVLSYALEHDDVYIKIVSDKKIDYVFLTGSAWAPSIEPEYNITNGDYVVTYYNVIDLMESYCNETAENDKPADCVGTVGNIMLFPTNDVKVMDMDAVVFGGDVSAVTDKTEDDKEEEKETEAEIEDDKADTVETNNNNSDSGNETIVYDTKFSTNIGAWGQVEGGFTTGTNPTITDVLNYALDNDNVYIKIVADKKIDYVFLTGAAWAPSIEPEYNITNGDYVVTYYNVIDLMESYCNETAESDKPADCVDTVGNIMLFPTNDVKVSDMDAVVLKGKPSGKVTTNENTTDNGNANGNSSNGTVLTGGTGKLSADGIVVAGTSYSEKVVYNTDFKVSMDGGAGAMFLIEQGAFTTGSNPSIQDVLNYAKKNGINEEDVYVRLESDGNIMWVSLVNSPADQVTHVEPVTITDDDKVIGYYSVKQLVKNYCDKFGGNNADNATTIVLNSGYNSSANVYDMDVVVLTKGKETPKPTSFEGWMDNAKKESLTSLGNFYRVKQVIEKAKKGEDLTIAYIGGSITEDDNNPNCYARRSYNAFVEKYAKDKNKCHYVNAGIRATPSTLGAIRLDDHVLSSNPDIVFIEFAVNDGGEDIYKDAFESMVRACLEHDSKPAVVPIFSRMDNGYSSQDSKKKIGAHYDLPMISYADGITYLLDNKVIEWSDFSDDYTHPHAEGHAIVADFIAYFYDVVDKSAAPDADIKIPGIYNKSGELQYLNATMITNSTNEKSMGAWKDGSTGFRFSDGWSKKNTNDNSPLVIEFTGKHAYVLFSAHDSSYGTLVAKVYYNDKLVNTVEMDEGTGGWGGADIKTLYNADKSGKYRIEFTAKENKVNCNLNVLGVGYTD